MSGPDTSIVRYLDDGSLSDVNWNDYRLVRTYRTHLRNMERSFGEALTPEQQNRLYYGPEAEQDPDIIQEIGVFGEYERSTE